MRIFTIALLFFFTFSFCCGGIEEEAVGVLKVQNLTDFLRKSNLFLGKVNPHTGNRAVTLVTSEMFSPALSALNFQKPVTAYLFFAKPGIQPVIFGELQKGKKTENFVFLPGQVLTPQVQKNGSVKYVDKKFAERTKQLHADSIKLPGNALAGKYFFRKGIRLPGQTEADEEITVFLSTQFKQASFTLDYPKEDLMQAELELIAAGESTLINYSNSSHPRLKEKTYLLPQPEYYFYGEFPANAAMAEGIISFFSWISPDFANDEHIYGAFLHAAAAGDHSTALMISKDRDYYMISGLLSSEEQKKRLETFLKSHGNSYSGQAFMFHNDDGTDVYVKIIGNAANLLLKRKNGITRGVSQVFAGLRKFRPALSEREFLSGRFRQSDGKYDNAISVTMSNGKFRLKAKLHPAAVMYTLPRLFTGEDLFHE